MADFEHNLEPPQSVTYALSPLAPLFHPVQPELLKLSNTTPSTDHQKVIKSPGTQLYLTSYGTSCLPKPKIDYDPYDRSTNGLHNQLQTVQFKKLRKTNLNLTTRKCNNPVTTPYQCPKEPSVACHPATGLGKGGDFIRANIAIEIGK